MLHAIITTKLLFVAVFLELSIYGQNPSSQNLFPFFPVISVSKSAFTFVSGQFRTRIDLFESTVNPPSISQNKLSPSRFAALLWSSDLIVQANEIITTLTLISSGMSAIVTVHTDALPFRSGRFQNIRRPYRLPDRWPNFDDFSHVTSRDQT